MGKRIHICGDPNDPCDMDCLNNLPGGPKAPITHADYEALERRLEEAWRLVEAWKTNTAKAMQRLAWLESTLKRKDVQKGRYIEKILNLEDRLAEVENWKREQLAVEATWDIQAVGCQLGLKWGENIRPKIQPGIRALQMRVTDLEQELEYRTGVQRKLQMRIDDIRTALRGLVEAAKSASCYLDQPHFDDLIAAIAAAEEVAGE